MISVAECLKIMADGQPFRCRVVAYDRRRKKGGEILEYEAVLLSEAQMLALRPDRALTKREKMNDRPDRRNPNHSEYFTRNIRICQNGHPTSLLRKIHPPLLIEFNGQPVTP
jgi:hypothetical protein